MNYKAHWEKIYSDKPAQAVSWYQAIPTVSLALINDVASNNDDAIIDVGGGASLLIDHLIAQGNKHLTVLDIAGNAIHQAKARLGEDAKYVNWIEADITAFSSPHRFDIWHDRAVFHFLVASEDRRKYRTALLRHLKPNGHVILASFAIGGPEKCSGLDIVQYDAKKLVAELGGAFVLLKQQTERHITPSGTEQLFEYFLLQRCAS